MSPHDSATPNDPGSGASRKVTGSIDSAFQHGDLVAGRFRIVRFIARGGMGELYQAEDLELNDQVALKTIRSEIASDERMNQRFRREVQLARKITHPNICRIFDLFQHQPASSVGAAPPPIFFVTMELLQGETLAELLKRDGPLSPERARPIALQMAGALSAAHAVGVIHRDFKPNNVMILKPESASAAPRVVVTDFGLAYSVSDETGATTSISGAGEIVGTPEYMAPEQIQGEMATPATDVFALGIVLYELVTGVPPFAAPTPVASALRRISGPPPRRLSELVPNIPVVLDRVVTRCMDSSPANRFEDGAAVVSALKIDEGIVAPPPSRRLVPILIAGLIVLALISVFLWRNRRPNEQSAPAIVNQAVEVVARPAVAVLGFRNLTGRKDTQWLSMALAEMLTTELTATEVLRTVPGETINRMKTELALADADSFSPETLARIRQNLGTDFAVFGSYVTVGEGSDATIRLDVRLQDARDGTTVASFGETGKEANLLEVVARAGGRLRDRLGVELKPESLASIRASEPASSDAVRLYAEGLMRLRSFDAIAARGLLERATQVDPKFPLAHSALASTWSALGYDARARQSAERAYELSSSLPRPDRLQVEGTYREMARSWKEAITVWRTLVDLFPDDIEHTLRLANAQIASGAAKDGLSTIDSFRKRFPATKDPRLELMSAAAARTLSDFKLMESSAAAAASSGEAQGARLLVAAAKLRQGEALMRQGQIDRSTGLIEESRRLYADAGDRIGVARALNAFGSAISDGPDPKRSLAMWEEGLGISRAVGNQDLVASFLNNQAILYRRAGDLQTSLRMNQEALAIRREIGDRTNETISLNNIGNVLLDLDDVKGATEHYEKSAEMSREIGDRQSLARALNNAAESLKLQGEVARARKTLDEALKIRRSIAQPASVASSLANLGNIAMLQGDLATARQALTESQEIDRPLKNSRSIAYSSYFLGELALIQGDMAGAQRQHQEALGLRTQLGEKGTAAQSRAALAVIALEQKRAADAESLAREAAVVFEEQRTANNEALARSTMALAMLAQGKRETARREIDRARALLRNTQDVLSRMSVSIAAAQVDALSSPEAAIRELESLRSEAVKRAVPRYEFEARRALAAIEGPRSSNGAARLTSLRKDARERGFLLYLP